MTIERQPMSRAKKVTLWLITLGILIPGAYGFVSKLVEFFRTVRMEGEGGDFAIVPILNYLLMTAGFTCLLVWAVMNGMFRDIEAPKYAMLEREAQLERSEEQGGSE